MLTITAISSSSSGNLYILDNGKSRLLLECGVPWKQIQKAIYFNISNVSGCLLSHEHQDHAKSAKDITKAGIELYTSAGTAGKIGVTGHRLNVIESLKQVKINEWSVLPFGVEHDAAEPLGFLIVSGKEKILFITDTAYCQYRFKGLTHIMIEANFDDDILDNNIKAGVVEHSRRKRLLESHMSIKRVKDFLLASDLSKLQEIWLLHLSSANSDEVQFKLDVQRLAGVPVFVA